MEDKFTSQNDPNLPVKDSPSTNTLLDLSSVYRQCKVEEPHPTAAIVKQHSCEQIFDQHSNIKQLKFATTFTAEGRPKGQNTWNVNFPALSDAANFIDWRTENICDKSLEPASPDSPEKDSSADVYEKIKTIWDDESLVECKTGTTRPRAKPMLGFNDSSESRESTDISCPEINSPLMDEVPKLKTGLDLLQIGPKQNVKTPRPESIDSKPRKVKLEPFKPREKDRISSYVLPKLKTGIDLSEIYRNRKVKTPLPTPRSIKRQLSIPQEIMQTAAPSNPCLKLIFFILVGVSAAIISSLWNEINENPSDFTNASLELQKSIYGQDDAINQLIDHYRENIETFNVVVLVGGTGVGKSYTGKIITKHFPHKHNVFEYSPPLGNDHEAAYNSLSSMHCNLVIFEHLKLDHLTDLVSFVKLLNSKKQYCIMILAMINPEITDDNLTKILNLEESLDEINKAFSLVNIPIKTISFSPLTSDILDICIKDEAKKNDIRLTDEQSQEIKKHLVLTNSGCKGAYAKVQLYARTLPMKETN